MKKLALLSFSILVSTLPAHGFSSKTFIDPTDGNFDMGEFLAENAYGFLPVPIIITEPSLGYGGGLSAIFLHESDEQRKKRQEAALNSYDGGAQLLTPGISVAGGFKTANGSWLGFGGHRQVWGQDKVRYTIGAGYGDVNMHFYRPNAADNAKGVEVNMAGPGLMQRAQFRVGDSRFFVGVSQNYFAGDFKVEDRDQLSGLLGDIYNLSPAVSGIGIAVSYDSKNSFLYPTAGADYDAEYMWYRSGLGGDYDYETLQLKLIQYFEVTDQLYLGLKGQLNGVVISDNESLPLPAYPDINMRGVPRNRYQGEYSSSLQAQFTYRVTPRWLLSAFGGVGSAAESSGKLYDDDITAYGGGFRYLIARRYGLHWGIDYATSDADSAFYFNVGTGF